MKCYWTVNSSYWHPLRVSQYEVNTSWPPQQKSIVLQYWKPKINSFSYAEKKIMAYVHQLLDQPSQWQTSQQAGPCSVPKFTNTSITVKHLLIKNKNINQSKSSLLIWHYVSYLFLFMFVYFYKKPSCFVIVEEWEVVIFRILEFLPPVRFRVSWFRGYYWPWMLRTTMFLFFFLILQLTRSYRLKSRASTLKAKVVPLMCILFEKLKFEAFLPVLMHNSKVWKVQKVKVQGHLRVTICFQRNVSETVLAINLLLHVYTVLRLFSYNALQSSKCDHWT